MSRKYNSKYIGKTMQGFLVLEGFYEVNQHGNHVAKFKVKCIHCNKIQSRIAVKITHGNACCDCQKPPKRNGDRSTRLGRIYHGMLQRCSNSNREGYEYYGGKGVVVCDEWQTYPPFMEWSLANGYRDNLTLDRIDSDGDYSPSNCRWATDKMQANNNSGNHLLTYDGKTQSVQQWGEELDIKPNTIITRIRRGWDTERALTTEVK